MAYDPSRPRVAQLDDPDEVGQSEYRALHELIVDGTADLPGSQRDEMALAMLDEVREHADLLAARLRGERDDELTGA